MNLKAMLDEIRANLHAPVPRLGAALRVVDNIEAGFVVAEPAEPGIVVGMDLSDAGIARADAAVAAGLDCVSTLENGECDPAVEHCPVHDAEPAHAWPDKKKRW